LSLKDRQEFGDAACQLRKLSLVDARLMEDLQIEVRVGLTPYHLNRAPDHLKQSKAGRRSGTGAQPRAVEIIVGMSNMMAWRLPAGLGSVLGHGQAPTNPLVPIRHAQQQRFPWSRLLESSRDTLGFGGLLQLPSTGGFTD
jgi:hypothetical protein